MVLSAFRIGLRRRPSYAQRHTIRVLDACSVSLTLYERKTGFVPSLSIIGVWRKEAPCSNAQVFRLGAPRSDAETCRPKTAYNDIGSRRLEAPRSDTGACHPKTPCNDAGAVTAKPYKSDANSVQYEITLVRLDADMQVVTRNLSGKGVVDLSR